MRALLRSLVVIALLGAAGLGAGFVWFTHEVARVEPDDARAEGMVALTGGAHRVADAVALLAQGRARRLLVTGVNPGTTRADIARTVGANARLANCCVDLGYQAMNTIGNAVETREWVEEHGFRSIIVVTSAYHMPRTLAELRRQLPRVTLVPYPVVSDNVRLDRWWLDPASARLLASEYAKLVVTLARGVIAIGGQAAASLGPGPARAGP
jgi:uncharacterized SAM-binding protein YcdF (DUF218 family)